MLRARQVWTYGKLVLRGERAKGGRGHRRTTQGVSVKFCSNAAVYIFLQFNIMADCLHTSLDNFKLLHKHVDISYH